MKTRDQLEQLALQIYDCVEHGDGRKAAQLLDDLHSEGMKDAGDIAETVLDQKENRFEYATNVSCKPRAAILEAIAKKQKP